MGSISRPASWYWREESFKPTKTRKKYIRSDRGREKKIGEILSGFQTYVLAPDIFPETPQEFISRLRQYMEQRIKPNLISVWDVDKFIKRQYPKQSTASIVEMWEAEPEPAEN